MSCGRIKRWILRNGGGELPARWRDHAAECEECASLIARMRALDGALSDGEVPDPGEAYWNAFGPGVARRVDELPLSRPVSQKVRPSWLKTWAPALGAAALALLIARELVIDPSPRSIMESDVPIVSQKPAMPETQPGEQDDSPEMAIVATPTDSSPAFRRQAGQPTENDIDESNEALTDADHQPGETRTTEQPAGTAASEFSETDVRPSPAAPNAAETAFNVPEEDSRVWPDRRVTKMGEVDSDQTQQTIEAEGRLSEHGTPGLAEKSFSIAAAGAESSATLPSLGRLEAPRTIRASHATDSQSPMDVMRLFDELRELRIQIGTLSAISSEARTPEQNRELCAGWYRMGTITDDALVLDSAIQQLSHCLETLDVADSDEWQAKSDQLSERRSSFNRE